MRTFTELLPRISPSTQETEPRNRHDGNAHSDILVLHHSIIESSLGTFVIDT